MPSDRLLTERERQQKYLDRLPKNFDYPLFNARRALESQRSSGYRNTAAAGREIVDNAIEAGASRIHIVFDTDRQDGRRSVTGIAFLDNGSGMLPNMERYALSWGGGTHYDNPAFIGKFGFGLPNASINQTRATEVYTRMDADAPFMKAILDIDAFAEFGSQSIRKPVPDELPQFVQSYMERTGFDLSHGTVVYWKRPDRHTYKRTATLKEHLVDDFGVTYRYLLVRPESPVELVVDGLKVQPVDPLFLMPEGRYYLPEDQGGAQKMESMTIPVVYYFDEENGGRRLERLSELSRLHQNDKNIIAAGTLHVRIARLPVGFADGKSSQRDGVTDAHRRFEIRKPRRGMSFVRSGREIETVDNFPKTPKEEAKDLGSWPLLQGYAYHWGVETSFSADLDDVLGVTNDKHGVRPVEDFWRVLSAEGVDAILNRENALRKKQEEKPPITISAASASPAELSAWDADAAGGTGLPPVPDAQKPEAAKGLETEAVHRAEEKAITSGWALTPEAIEDTRRAMEEESKRRPYRIEYYSAEDGPFFKPEWIGEQIVIRINQAHPFYHVLYGDLLRLTGGARAKEAVDLLLITLGRTELLSDEEMRLWYETQRKKQWSPFLETSMSSLRQRFQTPEDLIGN